MAMREAIETVVKFVLRQIVIGVALVAGAMWLTKPWEQA